MLGKFVCLFILVVSAEAGLWLDWSSAIWKPSWTIPANWTKPAVPVKIKYNVNLADTIDNDFYTRSNQFMYYLAKAPAQRIICAPKTYLASICLCERNPLYWDTSKSSIGKYCIPENSNMQVNMECFANNVNYSACNFPILGDDISNNNVITSIYNP